jgi:hypothetical protein
MDETLESRIDWMFANLMVFYKGGLSFTELNNMPIPLVLTYYDYADKINREIERQSKAKR